MDSAFKQAVREELCERLADGESLVAICRDEKMPSVRSVQTWMADDDEFAAQITRAREAGYLIRGERAVQDAKDAADPVKGRLAFDAERWYLGKLSNAFNEDKTRRVELTGRDGGPIEVNEIVLRGIRPD